jgi:hypothetical protein
MDDTKPLKLLTNAYADKKFIRTKCLTNNIKYMKKVNAYKCDHCSKIYENNSTCKAHEYKCYFNPRTKSCASCAFNLIEAASIMKDNSLIQFPSCMVNVDISKKGLQTRCSKYLNRKYREDKEIMLEVRSTYNPKSIIDSFIEKHPHIFH